MRMWMKRLHNFAMAGRKVGYSVAVKKMRGERGMGDTILSFELME